MTEKRKKGLKIYAIVIAILTVAVMFVIPDSFFMKFYQKNIDKVTNGLPQEPEEPEQLFTDYETQQERLLKKEYDYQYLLYDDKEGITYKCTGTLEGTKESGKCTSPKKIEYTEKNIKKVTGFDKNYIDVKYIFEKVKDIEPKVLNMDTDREFIYNLTLDKLDTEIVVYTSRDDIYRIDITNLKHVYVVKFNNIKY